MKHTVHLEPSGREFATSAGETVLDAALAAGVGLPYGCRDGACRSCRARLLAGAVEYPDGPPRGLSDWDRERGYALLCAAHAAGDLRLEVDELAGGPAAVRTLPARVVARERLAHDVMRLELALPEGESLSFLAGQYVDVVLRDGRRRAFSIASPPSSPGRLDLHVRLVPDGEFSRYVFEHLRERALLRIRGPLGSFYLRRRGARPAVLVAGGTGFAPVKSIVEDAVAGGWPAPLHVYRGARAREDLYLHDLALEWAAASPNVSYVPVLSEPRDGDAWSGRTGLVHAAVLEDFPDLTGHAVYMSGPPPMVEAGRVAFAARGADPADIHYDSFDYAHETGHDTA